MASIRARLTAWNGGMVMLLLLVFAIAGYLFLQAASLAQVDRTLAQQMRVADLAAHRASAATTDDSAAGQAFAQDLEAHGLLVFEPLAIPNTIFATPARFDEDDDAREAQKRRARDLRRAAEIDWADLRAHATHDHDDDPISIRGSHGGVRVSMDRMRIGSTRRLVFVAQPLAQTEDLLETARDAAVIALPAAALLAMLTGYLLARQALAPVASMTRQARRIGARNLHERLSVRNPGDELGKLATTFNDVLERADVALDQQRRFTADASHELRTPLAVIRAEADVALAGNAPSTDAPQDEYRSALTVIRDTSEQLSNIVNDLFLLARADSGRVSLARRPLRLDRLVTDTVSRMRALAEKRGLTLEAHAAFEDWYEGDDALLRRALVNLVDNAIKYSAASGRVDVTLDRAEGWHRIAVADTGPGISAEDQAHLFERFYRGDAARGHSESAGGAGAGLGLAITREIAMLHGGTVALRHSGASGSVFDLLLPDVVQPS